MLSSADREARMSRTRSSMSAAALGVLTTTFVTIGYNVPGGRCTPCSNIQDLFNEHGVQIMTPRYEADPAAPKVLLKQDWFAASARSDPPPGV